MKSYSAREKTYDRLKAYLLSGKIEPGERINQEMCAEILNVSRTPIREALQRMVSEGLVEKNESRGFRIPELSMDELEELFDMRSVLEAFAMRLVCQRITEEVVQKLKYCIEESEEALRRNDPEGIFKANTSFHNTLYLLIQDRKRFLFTLNNMKEHILKYRKQTLMHLSRARKSISAHKKIVFALESKDPNLAEYLMRLHIQESKEDAMEINFGSSGKAGTINRNRLAIISVK